MGIRETQIFGLHDEAIKFIDDNVVSVDREVDPCPHCGKFTRKVNVREERIYGSARSSGMFDDGPDLTEYKLKDGSMVREVVQAVPWSSGPCIFLCLEDSDGNKMFEWDNDYINNC